MEDARIALRYDQRASLKSVAAMAGCTEGELVRRGVDFVIAQELARSVRARGLARLANQTERVDPVTDIQQALTELRERASQAAAG